MAEGAELSMAFNWFKVLYKGLKPFCSYMRFNQETVEQAMRNAANSTQSYGAHLRSTDDVINELYAVAALWSNLLSKMNRMTTDDWAEWADMGLGRGDQNLRARDKLRDMYQQLSDLKEACNALKLATVSRYTLTTLSGIKGFAKAFTTATAMDAAALKDVLDKYDACLNLIGPIIEKINIVQRMNDRLVNLSRSARANGFN